MLNEPDFAFIASLAGEPARAAILSMLFDGRALPAGELARAAGVSPATASAHLAKLLEGGLVRLHAQGRHRYYSLASAEIASALETLGALSPRPPVRSLSSSLRARRLAFARTCYNHLAGELALAIADALVDCGALSRDEDGFRLTHRAPDLLARAGVRVEDVLPANDAHVRGCIDWTQRRHHISGPLGTALLRALLDRGAVRRGPERRVLVLTVQGREFLERELAVVLSADETIAS